MKKRPPPIILSILLFCSLLLAYLFSTLVQVHSYTIENHSYRFNVFLFVVAAVLAFFILLIAWSSTSKFLSNRFEISLARTQKLDVLSYIPLVLLLLLPFANSHYVDHRDFSSRVALFGFAILAGILSIKFMAHQKLKAEKSDFTQNFWKKISTFSIRKKLAVLFILALVVFNFGSVLMKKGGISYSGDEPHYLLITHSLLQDGDFNLSNNYSNQDYFAYMPGTLKLDAHLAPGTYGYSMHSPGVSILLFPFYALGLLVSKGAVFYFVRFGMSIFGALLG
ncbi:MAG: hypothetical protein V3R45_06870, partial [Candidatus Aminicenantaceae bacterium]